MNYGVYKNARNASWRCLIDCNVGSVPINPIAIAERYGIECRATKSEFLNGSSGIISTKLVRVCV